MHEFGQSRAIGLADLSGVISVAAHKSFRRAAAHLSISPSALSHSVAALEARLGVRLFHRTTRSVSLTEAGERFLARVRPAVGQIELAVEAVNEDRDKPQGTLRLNVSAGAALQMFRPFIVPYCRRYPDMRIDLVVDGRLVDIVEDGFDAGVRLAESVPRDMVAIPCGPPVRFAVVASPRYLARHPRPVAPSDLLQHDCIRNRMPSGAVLRWELSRRGEEVVLDVNGRLTLGHTRLLVDAALEGLGVAYVSEQDALHDIARGRLVRLLEEWTPPSPGACLYYPDRRVSAGLRAFIDLMKEASSRAPSKASPRRQPAPAMIAASRSGIERKGE